MVALKDLSAYRAELMGWAIVWIMALHFGFYSLKPLGFVAQYGYAGVEIFMFLSGFGLGFSLDKRPTLTGFYRRRAERIFPVYYLVGVLASILFFHDNIWQYLLRYSTLGFWTGGPYAEWYVPSIVLLYLLAPWLWRLGNSALAALAAALLSAALLLVERPDLIDGEHYFLLYRVPAFLFGMICSRWLRQGYDMRWLYGVMVAGLPVFLWLYPQFHRVYMYKYLSVLFMLPVFLCVLTAVSRYIRVLNPLMRHLGEASLEIYLVQWLFFMPIINGTIARSDLTTMVLITVSSLAGILLRKASRDLIRWAHQS